MKTVVASLFACVVLAHSSQLLAQASAPELAAPKAAPAITPSSGTTEAKSPLPSGADDESGAAPSASEAQDIAANPADEAPASDKHDIGASRLEGELHKVEDERASYSRFWPWLTVGVGAAVTLGSAAVGAGYVYGCDGDCSTPSAIGIGVVAGTFIATIGAIWVVHANADVRELDSKRYQLEQELDRIRFSANLPNKSELRRSELFSMRFAFR